MRKRYLRDDIPWTCHMCPKLALGCPEVPVNGRPPIECAERPLRGKRRIARRRAAEFGECQPALTVKSN